jgi:hypothetical protein
MPLMGLAGRISTECYIPLSEGFFDVEFTGAIRAMQTLGCCCWHEERLKNPPATLRVDPRSLECRAKHKLWNDFGNGIRKSLLLFGLCDRTESYEPNSLDRATKTRSAPSAFVPKANLVAIVKPNPQTRQKRVLKSMRHQLSAGYREEVKISETRCGVRCGIQVEQKNWFLRMRNELKKC